MISNQFIKDTSTKWQTSEQNVRREYIQHLFLSHFYRHSDSDKIYFKGGTALRIIYRSPRFSEDLDLAQLLLHLVKLRILSFKQLMKLNEKES